MFGEYSVIKVIICDRRMHFKKINGMWVSPSGYFWYGPNYSQQLYENEAVRGRLAVFLMASAVKCCKAPRSLAHVVWSF